MRSETKPIQLNHLTERVLGLATLREPARVSALWTRVRFSPMLLFGLIFITGLMAGMLVLGIFMWRTNSAPPGQYPPAYERMYMTWVADRYASSGNVARVRQDLILWTPEDTLRVLATLQMETTDPEARRRIVMLAGALGGSAPSTTTNTSTSARPSFFTQPAFLASMFLAMGLLLGAIGIMVVPMLRERKLTAEELTAPVDQIDANLEELLADVQIGTLEPEVETKPEETPEEKKEEILPAETDADADTSSGLGDLASLFEEEDTSLSTLEAFCKGLTEVNIDELLGLGKRVIERFRTSEPRLPKG